MDDGIRMEREKMRFLKERADYIIDTSNLLTRELKQEIDRIFVDNQDFCNMMISVLSFDLNMEYRQMRISCLTCVSCRIHTMWTNSDR